MPIKAYKGFNKDMTCRGFQFEGGKTYEEPEAKLCESGFHACENPLDCFRYYEPADSEYHEVELEDVSNERNDDTKICAKKIKIGAKIDIAGIVKAAFEYVSEQTTSANSATGDRSANSATGNDSANSATGYRSANSATGNDSANSATGYHSANSATGDRSANSATGYGSANVSTGYKGSNEGADGTINIGWGKNDKCKGALGAYIVLCERDEWDGEKYPLIGEPKLAKVDGVTLKPDVWYRLENGEFVECEDE